jgi:hypothetical protein
MTMLMMERGEEHEANSGSPHGIRPRRTIRNRVRIPELLALHARSVFENFHAEILNSLLEVESVGLAGLSDTMDPYKQSLQNVDAALARLNATLASYKLSSASSKSPTKAVPAPPPPPAQQKRKQGEKGPVQTVSENPIQPPATAEFSSEHIRPVQEGGAWAQALNLRSTQGIPKVRT